jgi:phosphohistidine phosphatase
MRHGQAQPKAAFGDDDDASRGLTPEGTAKVRKVLSIAKYTFNVELDRILSSPYKRALQTAELAKEILEPKKPKIVEDQALLSEKNSYELYALVSKQKFLPQDRVLVVSHQPLLGEAISDLVGTEEAKISFAPGSMARVDVAGETPRSKSGSLVWLISSDAV